MTKIFFLYSVNICDIKNLKRNLVAPQLLELTPHPPDMIFHEYGCVFTRFHTMAVCVILATWKWYQSISGEILTN